LTCSREVEYAQNDLLSGWRRFGMDAMGKEKEETLHVQIIRGEKDGYF